MTLTRRDLFRTGVGLGVTATALSALPAFAEEVDPKVWGTRDWAARPPIGTVALLRRVPTFIVVHHTATANTADTSRAHAFKLSRSIQNFHMDRRGWIDTGQQFTNSRGGHITEGRHRSLEAVGSGDRHVSGANVANHNNEVVGIENEGLYTQVDMPAAQWASLVELVSFIARKYAIPASQIRGHRDFSNTQCPGNVLYGRLPELRTAVGARLAQPVEQPKVWPLLQPGDTGKKVLAAQYLLRDHGERDVPVDGVFGQSTFAAMSRFAGSAADEPCYPTDVDDESGLIGGAAWPALIRRVDPADGSHAALAARALTPSRPGVIDTGDWLTMLNQ